MTRKTTQNAAVPCVVDVPDVSKCILPPDTSYIFDWSHIALIRITLSSAMKVRYTSFQILPKSKFCASTLQDRIGHQDWHQGGHRQDFDGGCFYFVSYPLHFSSFPLSPFHFCFPSLCLFFPSPSTPFPLPLAVSSSENEFGAL